jgi:hypothetical protein
VQDRAYELALEAAQRLFASFAFGLFALQVGASGLVATALGDGDPVDGAVELAVAAAVEAVALLGAGGGGDRGDAGEAGELAL